MTLSACDDGEGRSFGLELREKRTLKFGTLISNFQGFIYLSQIRRLPLPPQVAKIFLF